MEKIKIGYLPMYVKMYDDRNPRRRDHLVAYMEMLVETLERYGLDIIVADEVCRIKDEFDRAVCKFNDAGVAAVITQHLAYSPSLEAIDALLQLKAPIIVFDTTPNYELLRSADVENRLSDNHGIHGVQDMCNLLRRNHKPYHICAGHIEDGKVIHKVVRMCRAAALKQAYETARIGSVGGHFSGMGDFLISDEQYKQEIGADVLYMTPDVVSEYLRSVTEEEIDQELALDAEKYTIEVTFCEEYRSATRSGLAVRKWMDDHQLTSCSINFLTLDVCGLPKMPFPECCKILERGKGYAGEGDTLTAGLVGALFALYPDTTFAEMFCPDWEQGTILLSHMGESNPNLAQWKPIIRDKTFKYNSCGNTVAMYTCARAGQAAIVNLAPTEDSFTLIICPGEMLNVGLEHGAYRYATQGWFKPSKALPQFLEEFSLAGGTHHSALVYDANLDELRTFGQMMGFDVVVI